MASKVFRPSRLISVGIVVVVAAWVISGFLQGEPDAGGDIATATVAVDQPQVPIQRVGVTTVAPEQHQRQVILSCVTEADRRAKAVARGAGVITQLLISRGNTVTSGQTVATISDEGRQAALLQAQSLLDQRQAEYDANVSLIERGNAPRNQLPALQAGLAAAKAAVAAAQAEADKTSVKSPIGGVADTVPVQVGQAVQIGTEIANIVDPDPMLAVGAVSEARRSSIKTGQPATVRFIDGVTVEATVSFVGLSADTATRTYPVEALMRNTSQEIADGVTCEMAVTLAPIEAVAVSRSALVFSDAGQLGVRIADAEDTARFVPIEIVDDGREHVWITGLDGPARVIVVGQDFVKDGDPVEAASAADSGLTSESPT